MQPTDIALIRTPSDPQVHPDGRQVAFVVSQPDLHEDAYRKSIWLHDGDSVRQLTSGHQDWRPRWSPDGKRLAFLRAPLGRPTEAVVVVLDPEGGDETVLAQFAIGASEAEWAPDGSAMAVVATEWTADFAGLSEDERDRTPARLTRHHFQVDNQAPQHDRRKHIWLVDDHGRRAITEGDHDEHSVAWHPGGSRLAFISSRGGPTAPGNQVFEIDADGGDETAVTGQGLFDGVGYDTAGVLHVVGLLDAWEHPSVSAVYRLGDSGPVDLTGHLDRNPLPYSPTIAPKGPRFVDDGFVTVLEDNGRVHVVKVNDAGVETLVDGDVVVTGAAPIGEGVVYAASSTTDLPELYLLAKGSVEALTDLNSELDVKLIAPEEFTVVSDGVEITVWVYLPPGDDDVPVLFNIHGGPASQYGVGLFDEFQVYAGAGYGVVAANPRGSSGRGKDFVRGVVGTWATEDTPPDVRDFNAIIDGALERFPRLDSERLGVMGGSYGGWAASQLIGRDQRYRSAVVERAVTQWQSFWGTSDIGPWFAKMYIGTDVTDDPDGYWRASPMSHAHKVTTPTLVLHSVSDWRTPLEQGLQFFTVLQHNGVPSELLRFPDEGHELSRLGDPRHRVERFEAILDWHGRWL